MYTGIHACQRTHYFTETVRCARIRSLRSYRVPGRRDTAFMKREIAFRGAVQTRATFSLPTFRRRSSTQAPFKHSHSANQVRRHSANRQSGAIPDSANQAHNQAPFRQSGARGGGGAGLWGLLLTSHQRFQSVLFRVSFTCSQRRHSGNETRLREKGLKDGEASRRELQSRYT